MPEFISIVFCMTRLPSSVMWIPPSTVNRLCGTSVVRPGNVHEISGLGIPVATQFNFTGDPRLALVIEVNVLVICGGKTITATGYDRVVEPKELEALQMYVPLSKVATFLSCRVPFGNRNTRPMDWGLSKTRPFGSVHMTDACGQLSTVQGKLRLRPYVIFIPPGKAKLQQ